MFNLLIGLFINLPIAIFCGVVGITSLDDTPILGWLCLFCYFTNIVFAVLNILVFSGVIQ